MNVTAGEGRGAFERRIPSFVTLVGLLLCAALASGAAQDGDGPVHSEVFVSGKEGYHTYRIPSVIVSRKGTVLAFCEGRKDGSGDAGDIDLVLRRSFDGGATWQPMQVVWDDGRNTCGNPTAVVDRDTGTVWLLLTHNLGEDTQKQIVQRTSKGTRTVWVAKSEDDGATWSKPVEITKDVKKPEWTWYGTGEGVGIQTRTGRLVIPGESREGARSFSLVFTSDDHGRTWQPGGAVGDIFGESQVVELSDGTLMINMRAHLEDDLKGLKRNRGVATSKDGGLTWSTAVQDPVLVDPLCQGSLLRYTRRPEQAKDRLLFSNPASREKRVRMTVRLSYDEGRTWPVEKVLHEGPASYSCLTVLPDFTIGCLYERGERRISEKVSFARLSLGWLTGGKDSPRGEAPK